MRNSLILVGCCFAAACVHRPPLMLQASFDGGKCIVRADGRVLGQDLDDARLRALAKVHGARAVLQSDAQVPYRCVGGIVFNLQRAGYRLVSVNGAPVVRH